MPSSDLSERRVGVIDIGSNSVRLVIYETVGAAAAPIYSEKVLAGLGRSLKTDGRLYAPGAAQTFKALSRFKALCTAHALDEICIVATAAMREATDGPEFIARVKSEIGLEIECLSGAQEAQMAAYGVISEQARAKGVVADLGGASLELIRVNDRQVSGGKTFPLGPFVMSNNTPSTYDPNILRLSIAQGLSGIEQDYSLGADSLYLVGGAWRNLALIHNKRKGYPMPILHGYAMPSEDALALARWAGETAAQDLMSWPRLSSRRAETLPYCGLMLELLIQKLNPKEIVISPSGVREGRLYTSLPAHVRERDALMDACRQLAAGNQQGTDFGLPLYTWLRSVFDALPTCFETIAENRLRQAACLLVGMGKGLHPEHRANLVFSDVLYAPLSGLTHKERAYLALMLYASYTGSSHTPNDAAIDYHLTGREKKAARIFGTAMRLGTVISGQSAKTLSRFDFTASDAGLSLRVDDEWQALLNRRGVMRLKALGSLIGVPVSSNWIESEA